MDAYVAELVALLERVVTARDSQTVKGATDELQKVWYKRPDTVPALVHVLQTHASPQVRQLAGVEARKLVPRFWFGKENALDVAQQEAIKTSLLAKSLGEHDDLVRHTAARVISAIASIDLDDNRWDALLPELLRAARAQDAPTRETATYILYALLDSSDYCAAAAENPTELLAIFQHTLADPDSLAVRVNTVLALSGLSTALTANEAVQFQQLVPGIVAVLEQCVAADDEKAATQIFESLSELIDADASLLGAAFGELLAHMVRRYGNDAAIDPEFRVAAMRVVATAAAYRYKRIQRLKLAPELTKLLVELVAGECARDSGDDDDDDDDDDDVTVLQITLQTLESLASRLPPSQVVVPLLHLLPTLVNTSDPALQRAGYLAFTACADGAPEFVASETQTLLPWIVQGLQSAAAPVRVAALQALCQLGEGANEQLSAQHHSLVPLVYGILDSAPSLKVCQSACVALAAIVRTLSNDVVSQEYLPGLVPRLLAVVRDNGNVELKGFVVGTLGTTAEVAGRNFLPFFAETAQVLTTFVAALQPDAELDAPAAKLISESMGTLARLASAVGAEQFMPYLDGWMTAAIAALASENSELREMIPLYLCEMAEVYKDGLQKYLPHIVPRLLNVLDQEEIYQEDIVQEALAGADPAELDFEEDFADGLKVNSELCMEKEFALDCLGALWMQLPEGMQPYFEQSLAQFRAQSEHFYEDIRQSSIVGLWRMFTSLPANPQVKDFTWEVTKDFLDAESDMNVVDTVFELITTGCKKHGAQVFPDEEAVKTVLSSVYEVIKKTHRVFEEFDGDDDTDAAGDEDSEAASQLVQTALELLTAIAGVMGEQFGPLFEQFAAALRPYATSQVDQERENGVGEFAELVGALKTSVSPWTGALMQAFVAALDDSNESVRSLAAYGAGLLATYSTEESTVLGACPALFEKIGAMLRAAEGANARAVANAAGAYARLALRYPQIAPQDCLVVLSVALPLTDAFEEYPPVLQFLAKSDLPPTAKPLIATLWDQHLDAERRNSVKSVSYHPADDPLGDDEAMQAWKSCAQRLGVN